jgi:ATP-dependent helicase HrpA
MPATTPSLPAIVQQVMRTDYFRLKRSWMRLHAADRSVGGRGGGQERAEDTEALRKWHQRAEASAELRRRRSEQVPQLQYDPELPITAHREQIIDLIQSRQTLVVCGETGSGKSTQLPKFCLEAGLGRAAMIGHTQPRRLAARAISDRLAEELGSRVGELVGFKIRFTDATRDQTLIKLMTDGVLLAETQSDRYFDRYDAVIIDEAHERSLNIDFLLGYLKDIRARRPDLRLIITSATIDPQRFAAHFADEHGPAPIVEVSGRTYPVEIHYRALEEEASESDRDPQSRAIARAVDELQAEGPGDILAFFPTERDIRLAAKYLRGHFAQQGLERQVEILPLYARLSHAEQNKIFAPHNKRRIVLATNVAESSLTVPGIRYVVDTGLVRISRYAPRSRVQRLPIESVSQASANQRAGRCGRLGPGVCIRLYSEEDFERRPKFTTPEIRRSDLASVLLQSHMLRLGRLEEFPLMDVPGADSLRDGRRTLHELGAVDEQDRLTALGRQLGSLPCDPRVGRMLIEAQQRGCLADVVIIAAAIECQDVRQRPAGQQRQADEAHAQFQDPHSDFLSYLRLWDFYQRLRSQLGRSRLEKALQQNFLSYQGFREWADVVRQLKELMQQAKLWSHDRRITLPRVETGSGPQPSGKQQQPAGNNKRESRQDKTVSAPQKLKRPDGYAAIHQSLLAGLLSGIAVRGDGYEYKAAGGLSVSLWPGSGLFQRQPKWVVMAEVVETNRRYGRTVAEVDVEWIEAAGKSLLKHTYSDPHWSSKTGSAMVYRRSTLFGLPVVVGRRMQLAPIDPSAARELMIEHGLVADQWRCDAAFYRHNQELLADMQELANRTRNREFIVDRFQLFNFYQQRVPAEIVDLATLRRWVKQHRGSAAEKALWMTADDLTQQPGVDQAVDQSYPNTLDVGASSLPLEYQFEPGSDRDGVSLTVPKSALRQLSEERLGWLVPGLLEEKILCLIRALPKSQRTSFVPAPDVARQLSAQLADHPRDQPFTRVLCDVMTRYSGEPIGPQDFLIEKLPAHLRFLVRVVDEHGQVVAESRDLNVLQQQFAGEAATVEASLPAASDWEDQTVAPDKFDGIPSPVSVRRGGLKVAAFPCLVDLGDSVQLRLAETEADASACNRQGSVRLFALKHAKQLRSQVAHLPELDRSAVRLASWIPSSALRPRLGDLMARIAFVEDRPQLSSREDFEARNALSGSRIPLAAQEIAAWLPRLAEQLHMLRLKLESAPAVWKEVTDDVQRQLNSLLPPDCLQTTAWQSLQEYPRYIAAICMRLDKLSAGGVTKDRKLRAPIERIWDGYEERKEQAQDMASQARLEQLRWLIEEFRVSVFAQQLGTRQTVSEKRLRDLLESL